MSARRTSPYRGTRGISLPGLALVVTAHGLAFFALPRMAGLTPPPLAVLTVGLLAPALPDPPRQEPPRPKIAPPPPRPIEKPAVSRPMRESVPPALPADTVLSIPAPAAALPAVPPAPTFTPAADSPPPPPAAPTPPRFDADYLDNPKPRYPPLARRMDEEGRVVLRVHVAANGLPLEVVLRTGSGSARLDQAALDTVWRWKFVPARLGGEAVAATVLVPIVFSLKD